MGPRTVFDVGCFQGLVFRKSHEHVAVLGAQRWRSTPRVLITPYILRSIIIVSTSRTNSIEAFRNLCVVGEGGPKAWSTGGTKELPLDVQWV